MNESAQTVRVTITHTVYVDVTPEYGSDGAMTEAFLLQAEYAALDKIDDNDSDRSAKVEVVPDGI